MNILVIRFSAMGDVALSVPVMKALIKKYPDIQVIVITKPRFAALFGQIERVTCLGIDVDKKYRGVIGLLKLKRELQRHYQPQMIVDIHDVIRSRILSFYFRWSRVPIFRIDKGRKEKKALVRKKHKILKPLKHATIRYCETFESAGYSLRIKEEDLGFNAAVTPDLFLKERHLLKSEKWIGIAPFAAHKWKIWPLEKMERVVEAFDRENNKIFLFGGGKEEIKLLGALDKKFKNTVLVAGKLTIEEELGLIEKLDLMISMDSANMHLAAISRIPVISIWGPTHPFAGFPPLNNNEQYMIQPPRKQFPERPNSIYGNKPCPDKNNNCLDSITPKDVLEVAERILTQKS